MLAAKETTLMMCARETWAAPNTTVASNVLLKHDITFESFRKRNMSVSFFRNNLLFALAIEIHISMCINIKLQASSGL